MPKRIVMDHRVEVLPMPSKVITVDGSVVVVEGRTHISMLMEDHHHEDNPATTMVIDCTPDATANEFLEHAENMEEGYDNMVGYTVAFLCDYYNGISVSHLEGWYKEGENNNGEIWLNVMEDGKWYPYRPVVRHENQQDPFHEYGVFGALGATLIVDDKGDTYMFWGQDLVGDDTHVGVCVARRLAGLSQWNKMIHDSFNHVGLDVVGTPVFDGYFPRIFERDDSIFMLYMRHDIIYYRECTEFPLGWGEERRLLPSKTEKGYYPAEYNGRIYYCTEIRGGFPGRRLAMVSSLYNIVEEEEDE